MLIDRRTIVTSAVLFTATLGLFVLSFLTYFKGGESYEFCHYAEISSNILHGRGFTSNLYFPYLLAYYKKVGIEISKAGFATDRFILFSLWSAFWMFLGTGGDFGMALGNGVAHGLWVVLIYWIGRTLFNERTALIGAILWIIHPVVLAGLDLYGYPDIFFGLIFGLLNILFYRVLLNPRERRGRACFGLGLLAALAYLARYNFIVWLPFYAVGLWMSGQENRGKNLIAFLTGFLGFWVSWTVYVIFKLGSYCPPLLLGNLASDTLVRGLPWSEYRTYALSEFMRWEVIFHLFHKSRVFLGIFLKDLPTLWKQGILFPWGIAGMLTSTAPALGFAGWLFGLFGWQAVIFSFLRYENLGYMSGRYYIWFAPYLLLYGIAFLERRLQSRVWRIVAVIVFTSLFWSWGKGYTRILRFSDHSSRLPVSRWPEIIYIRESTPPAASFVTNIPAQITWYARRRTVSITNRPEDLARQEADWPVDYLYLSAHRIGELSNYPAWRILLTDSQAHRDQVFRKMGFHLEKMFQDGILLKKDREG